MTKTPIALLASLLLAAASAYGQQFEAAPAPAGEQRTGYLAVSLDYRALLPPPPTAGELVDDLDISTVETLQAKTTPDRWSSANEDEAYVYPRFEAVFGGTIDRTHSPQLVHLLNRVERDVGIPTFAAKRDFARLRPFQRIQLTRVCGVGTPPPPDPNPTERSSYPSGHSAYGWAAALVLAQVAPERTALILARGYDYALSRVICAVHFPSDVEAGRALATAVVTRLAADPEFQRDLAVAKAEHSRAGR